MAIAEQTIPRRRLGATGVEVSILGLGGAHIGVQSMDDTEAIRLIEAAVEAGVTFMDNNWGYNQGRSEERMGRALEGRRDQVFLMTKVDARDRRGALDQLHESLRRLRTEYVDLWQIHEVIYDNDPDIMSAHGGAIEALHEAKQAGKTRFVGFTGHKDPLIHLRMLETYPFDAVQLPLNVMDAHFRSFQRHVLPALVARNIGAIGMKSLGGGWIPKSGVVTVEEALRYALSLCISTMIVGFESMEHLEAALRIARGFRPLTAVETAAILRKTCPIDVSGDGRYELYKTSKMFDAGIGRRQHGFPLDA